MADSTRTIEYQLQVDDTAAVDVHLLAPVDVPGTRPCVVFAHGAGGNMNQPLLVHLQFLLAGHGPACARFNFPYAQQGRRVPDRALRLLATWRAVLASLRELRVDAGMVLGGKSMGGRMASMLVASGEPADGLLLLGYPLHPAGKPERLRDEHFDDIRCRCLFVQGTRDPLCDRKLLTRSLSRLPGSVTLHAVEQGDHSFAVPRRSGIDAGEVSAAIDDAVLAWLEHC